MTRPISIQPPLPTPAVTPVALPQELTDEAVRFLARAGERLTASLDFDQSLENFQDILVPHVCDWFSIDLIQDDGALQCVAVTRRLVEVGRHQVGNIQLQTSIANKLSAELACSGAIIDQRQAILRRLESDRLLTLSLAARGRKLGVLTLVQSESDRRFGANPRILAEELARRIGAALDNALLFRSAQNEIKRHQWLQRLYASRRQILARIATRAPVEEVMVQLTAMIEQHDPTVLCSILLLDPEKQCLRVGAAPSLPPEYNEAVEGIKIGPAVGSCGTAAFRKESVIVTDTGTDPLWSAFREIAAKHRLAACWSMPIFTDNGEILGTVAIYTREPRSPDSFQLELLETCTYLARIALERGRVEEELEERARRQQSLVDLGTLAFTFDMLPEWTREVTKTVARMLDVEFCGVLELQPCGDLLLTAGVGWGNGLMGNATIPSAKGSQADGSLLVDEPLIVEGLASDSRIAIPDWLVEQGVVSGVTVSINQGEGRRWGVLGAHTRVSRRFTDDDAAYLQSVANLMGLVFERESSKQEIERNLASIDGLNMRLQRSISETHHRVKNNLQIISALVEAHAASEKHEVTVSDVEKIGHHVRGLAVIHDLLTHDTKADGTVQDISARDALNRLMPHLRLITEPRAIRVAVEDIRLPIRQSAGLSVLVNELVSNAMKHGKGEIELRLCRVGGEEPRACLQVCDDGPGFPPDFDPLKSANTGLEIIESIGKLDLRGDVVYENRPEGGARVSITFPILSAFEPPIPA